MNHIPDSKLSRRSALHLVLMSGIAAGLAHSLPALASSLPKVVVNRDPNCGCCHKWAEHLKQAGFPFEIVNSNDMSAIKRRLGVPDDLATCHTAEVAGYVVEGHVPADALLRFLEARPKAIGLAVPGMPSGSPGMEGDPPEVYEVFLFDKDGRSSFGRYKGTVQV